MDLGSDILNSVSARRSRTLAAAVHDELEALILSGSLHSGERLNEQELSKRFGVSRGPVREAYRLLERDGLIVSVANQGVYVRQLSVEDVLDLYDLRAVVAGYAAGKVAERATVDQKAELRDFVVSLDQCIAHEDEDGYFSLNIEFHDRMVDMSDSERSSKIYTSFGKEVRLSRRRVLQGLDSMRFSNDEHKLIVSAIEANDAAAARAAAEMHHLNGKRRWLAKL